MGRNDGIACCVFCGRDTRAKDSVCAICRGTISYHGEARGRPSRRWSAETDSPMDYAEDDKYDKTAAEDYHGESIRDDL